MKLRDLFPSYLLDKKIKDLKVTGISKDSRCLEKGDIFFVIEGKKYNVFDFLPQIENKVSVFVVDAKRKKEASMYIRYKPIIFVDDVKSWLKRCMDILYPAVKDSFKFIGVTGTNGKSTTAYLIHQLLKKMHQKSSFLGTTGYYLNGKRRESLLTTPDCFTLRKILSEMEKDTCYVVMEVSSQGIKEGRTKEIKFLQTIFTNLSRDHLDYHKSMEDYFCSKLRLFLDNPESFSIINIDDRYGKRLCREIEGKMRKIITYGTKKEASYRIRNVRLYRDKTYFCLDCSGMIFDVYIPFIGIHNVFNVTAAIISLNLLDFSLPEIIKKVFSLKAPPGRLEKVIDDVFVDYAHTPSALRNVLKSLKNLGYKKIICVFGCGGERDKGKRSRMGRIASLYADFSIITSDNPRNEDPYGICLQIEKGFLHSNYLLIPDRREAIFKALRLKGDRRDVAIVVAGKGHEEYQIVGNEKIPFSDREVIREFVEGKNGR